MELAIVKKLRWRTRVIAAKDTFDILPESTTVMVTAAQLAGLPFIFLQLHLGGGRFPESLQSSGL